MVSNNLGPKIIMLGIILLIVAIGTIPLALMVSTLAGNGDAGMIFIPVMIFSTITGPATLVIGLLLTKLRSEDYKHGRNLIISGIVMVAGGFYLYLYSNVNSFPYWSWVMGLGILIIIIGLANMVITRLRT